MGIHDALWDETTQRRLVADFAEALHTVATQTPSGPLIGAQAPRALDAGGRIAGYYQAVAADPHTHPIVLAFCALAAMQCVPECRREVARSTPADQIAYFVGACNVPPYEVRMCCHIGGTDTHQAKTPCELVTAERQVLARL